MGTGDPAAGERDLATLLRGLAPQLADEAYCFCSVAGAMADFESLSPWAAIREAEGLTLIVEAQVARQHRLAYDGEFSRITLLVNSSLHAVGLTAAVARALADEGISANVVAAAHHDHLFVPRGRANEALAILAQLSDRAVLA